MSYLKHLDWWAMFAIEFMCSIVITLALMRIIAFVKKDAAQKSMVKAKSSTSKNADIMNKSLDMNNLNKYLVMVYNDIEEFLLCGEYTELVTDETLQPGTTYVSDTNMFTVVEAR